MSQTQTMPVESAASAAAVLPVAIAATFTAEPIEMPLAFWLRTLGLDGRIAFAPYNQVFQQLLDPTSVLGQNTGGINLVLVRFEDWMRFQSQGPAEEVLRRNVEELIAAFRAFGSRSSAPTLVWVGPPSSTACKDPRLLALLSELESRLRGELQGLDSLHWLGPEALAPYPVDRTEDPQQDRIGHIPFTAQFYTALATAVARRIHLVRSAPHKVIAMDCDNTLWQGVVGEDGPTGITFPPGKRALQEFAVQQQGLGMVLCLVSKNVEPDVVAVFEQRPEMPLKREHIVGWRVNWQPKAQGIAELAAELNLGIDSFIFLDDNPVECAEMRAALPQVLTLQVPADDADIPEFLRHIWAFDRIKVTEEDRQRTLMYRQNAERNRFEQQTASIGDFLAGLNLKIDIAAPTEAEWPRVAQLTQRTNQFNFTTVRRSEAEVRGLAKEGMECLRVQVSDRFGDYGLVGVLIFGPFGDEMRIDTMLLSCRVLGRGIEHAMLARVGQLAVERGIPWMTAPFVPTAKNQPALNFLESVGAAYRLEREKGAVYRFPAEAAARVGYQPGNDARAALELARTGDAKKEKKKASAEASRIEKSAMYARIATELRRVEAVQRAIETAALARRPDLETAWAEPQTPRQRELAELWARLLHLDRVGIRDDFASLGGTSLVAAQIFAEVEARYGTRLPMTTILDAPTVEQLAKRLEGGARESLKLLKAGAEGGPALFLVHDGDGETLLYVNLARRMPPEIAVYGIEPHGNDRCAILHTRLPDMAAYYAEQIAKARPRGPYFVGGMCAGGVIAFEVAAQLRAKGLPVGMVAILDAAAPRAARRVGRIARQRGARFMQSLSAGPGSNVLQRVIGPVGKAAAKVRNLVVYEVKARTRRLSNKLRFRALRAATDRGTSVSWLAQGLTVRTVYEMAEAGYVPAGKLDAPVILFRATEGEGDDEPFIRRFADEQLGWGPYASRLELIETPGGHASMLREPNVAFMAERIKASVERILGQERNGSSV